MLFLSSLFQPVKNFPALLTNSTGDFFVTARPQRQPGTREVHLSDLGKFPLPEIDLPLLEQQIKWESTIFIVPPILRRSNIPIFYSAGERYPVYIPRASATICRYFAAMWGAEGDETATLVDGFLIIDSFVGGRE